MLINLKSIPALKKRTDANIGGIVFSYKLFYKIIDEK